MSSTVCKNHTVLCLKICIQFRDKTLQGTSSPRSLIIAPEYFQTIAQLATDIVNIPCSQSPLHMLGPRIFAWLQKLSFLGYQLATAAKIQSVNCPCSSIFIVRKQNVCIESIFQALVEKKKGKCFFNGIVFVW